LKAIIDWFAAIWHREVDDITKPLSTAIRRVEAFGQKLEDKVSKAEGFAKWGKAEVEKSRRVADKLRDLVL
jgi:hypothetical protein